MNAGWTGKKRKILNWMMWQEIENGGKRKSANKFII